MLSESTVASTAGMKGMSVSRRTLRRRLRSGLSGRQEETILFGFVKSPARLVIIHMAVSIGLHKESLCLVVIHMAVSIGLYKESLCLVVTESFSSKIINT